MTRQPQDGPEPRAPLRPPEEVMRLDRMGSFFPTRPSFMPTLIPSICSEGWSIDRPIARLDAEGAGGIRPE